MRISMLDVRSLRVFVYQLNSVFFRRWQGDLARKSLDQDREITGAIRSAETKLLREMDDIKREMQEMWEGDEWVSAFAQEMEFRLAQAVEEANTFLNHSIDPSSTLVHYHRRRIAIFHEAVELHTADTETIKYAIRQRDMIVHGRG